MGSMELVVLGSGAAEPHPKRSSSAYWLETSGGSVLLDCAPTAMFRMAQENLAWADLAAIWISHFHLDHVGGLAPLLFAMRHARDTQERVKPLRIFGAAGLRDLIDAFDKAGNYKLLKQPFPLEVIEVEPLEKFDIIPGVAAVALSTPHTDSSLAIHLTDEGGNSLVFTSDTGFSEVISAFASRVDLLVIECSFVKEKPVQIHLELAEAVHLIRRAAPGRAMLTHLYPEWDGVDFRNEVSRLSLGCEVIEAVDGLRVTI